jgi:hypothetical protein
MLFQAKRKMPGEYRGLNLCDNELYDCISQSIVVNELSGKNSFKNKRSKN